MPDHQFRTTIDVAVPAERAWAVLTDFAAYGAWCPTHREIRGEPVVGARLGLRLAADPAGERTIGVSARVRAVEAPRLLAFGGGAPGAPWLLDIHHEFRIEPLGAGHCRLHNDERFRGLLLAPVWTRLRARVERGYPAFNAAFKQRCEA